MKKAWLYISLLLPAISLSIFSTSALYRRHAEQETSVISRLVYFPKDALKTASLEFPGLLSDYLMLKTMTYMGEKIEKKKNLTKSEWQMVHQTLLQITSLDPRFWDPYLVAEVSLPWDAGMVDEANQMLLQAADVRKDDYRPNFFLWFNHYYFLKDPKTAAPYLEKAARIPGAPYYYKTLAARMSL
ncbi:MAG: hypothetical protein OEL85_07680, partial [Desulfobulbaceae bacterium]|nr:hypothetical protein [Desulfobulbaceae bacterium]